MARRRRLLFNRNFWEESDPEKNRQWRRRWTEPEFETRRVRYKRPPKPKL